MARPSTEHYLSKLLGMTVEVFENDGALLRVRGTVADYINAPVLVIHGDDGQTHHVSAALPRVEHLTSQRKVGFPPEKAEAADPAAEVSA